MIVETQADRLSMLGDWDSLTIGTGTPVPCVYDEPFAEEPGALGNAPELEVDRQSWYDAGGAVGVTLTVNSGTAGPRGPFVAREVRITEDGAMLRVRLEMQ